MDKEKTAMNCGICSNEFMESELIPAKLAGFNSSVHICPDCVSKSPEDMIKKSALILKAISIIASDKESLKESPEQRLARIMSLLEK